jgi:hypothetical protein
MILIDSRAFFLGAVKDLNNAFFVQIFLRHLMPLPRSSQSFPAVSWKRRLANTVKDANIEIFQSLWLFLTDGFMLFLMGIR